MDMHRVFIVGESLFAEGIIQMLTGSGAVEVVGTAPGIEVALPLLKTNYPDAVIVVNPGETATAIFDPILTAYPDLPIIRADPNADNVQVITSQRISARSLDLLVAIAALPKQE